VLGSRITAIIFVLRLTVIYEAEAKDVFDFLKNGNLFGTFTFFFALIIIFARWFFEVLKQNSKKQIKEYQVADNEKRHKVEVCPCTLSGSIVVEHNTIPVFANEHNEYGHQTVY